jgi:nucleotide-binding universal stress UspA family protein
VTVVTYLGEVDHSMCTVSSTNIICILSQLESGRRDPMTVFGTRVEVSIDNILFATDFSPASEKAGLYVEALAERYVSKVQIVHVVDLSAALQAPDPGGCIDCLRKGGESRLEKAEAHFALSGMKTEAILREGIDPVEEVLQIAKGKSVDLIVIGTRGQNGLTRLAFDSMAEQLVHRAESPVLTIGPDALPPETTGSFRQIVYATDFSPEAANAAIFALSFAQENGAHIYLCHVLPESSHYRHVDDQELTTKYIAALQCLIPDISCEWCEPECVLEHGYAADGILLLANRVRADLIVLGTRRFSRWFDSVKPGIAYEVIRAATCPVLTVCG